MQSGQTRCTERKGVQQRQKEVKEERAAGTCCCPLGHTLLHMCGGPQHVGFPSYCDGTQDTEPAQQCHCLAFNTAVCCNQKGKKKKMLVGVVPGARGWSMGT